MSAKLSRQLRWQLRQMELGNCRICGNAGNTQGGYCLDCRIIRRERARERYGYTRRYNSASYRVFENGGSVKVLETLIHDQNVHRQPSPPESVCSNAVLPQKNWRAVEASVK